VTVMDKETIKQIAAEIVAQLPFGNRTGPSWSAT
jgi:hypothetical protein